MFKAQIKKLSTFKKLINTIKDFCPTTSTDISFDCSKKFINLFVFDESQVALLSLKLRKKFFISYRCDFDVTFGLNLVDLTKVLQYADDNDTCIIKFTQNDKENILFTFYDATKTKIRICTSLKKCHCSFLAFLSFSNQIGISNREYDAIIEISTTEFAKTCQEISHFDDTVIIKAAKTFATFCAENGSYSITYNNSGENQESLINFDVMEEVATTFSIKYLLMCEKACGLAEWIKIFIAKDVPMVVEYKIPETPVYLRYYISPKVKEQENDEADMA